MCVVSAVNDWGRQQFPDWDKPIQWPLPIPAVIPGAPPPSSFTDEEVKLMKKFLALIKQAKDLDEAAGAPNCEDPKKAEFQEAVERRLAAVEEYIERFKRAVQP
jgi:hypothetical protein